MADTDETITEVKARVVALDGEYALVRVEQEGCGRCHEPGGCGGVRVERFFCPTQPLWRVANPRRAGIGEEVRVAIAAGAVGRSALLAYIFPVVALLLGASLGKSAAGEAGAILGASVGLALAWGAVFFRRRRGPGYKVERIPAATEEKKTAEQPFIR